MFLYFSYFFLFLLFSFFSFFSFFNPFSLSLVAGSAQNLIFFGLNFVMISLNISLEEKQNKFSACLGCTQPRGGLTSFFFSFFLFFFSFFLSFFPFFSKAGPHKAFNERSAWRIGAARWERPQCKGGWGVGKRLFFLCSSRKGPARRTPLQPKTPNSIPQNPRPLPPSLPPFQKISLKKN